MSTAAQVRDLALALPEAAQQEHHGMASFRVRGKIFATVPDDGHVRIMVDEAEIRAAASENPGTCSEFYWGKRLACVEVAVGAASRELLRELLTEAWRRKAPTSLTRDFLGPG